MNRILFALTDDPQLFTEGIVALLDRCFELQIDGRSDAAGTQSVRLRLKQDRPRILMVNFEVDAAQNLASRGFVNAGGELKNAGSILLSSAMTRHVLEEIQTIAAEVSTASVPLSSAKARSQLLSKRELEVFGLMRHAYSNKQIASWLSIAEGTVRRHISSIYAKLGAHSRLEAANRADELGLLVSRAT